MACSSEPTGYDGPGGDAGADVSANADPNVAGDDACGMRTDMLSNDNP